MTMALAGVGVLVTRPASQAQSLADRVRALGGTAVLLPVIDIQPPSFPQALAERIGRLREFDLIVFISPTAVEWSWPHILARHGDWPHGFRVAAVGQGTRRALQGHGMKHILYPEDASGGDALLALPTLVDHPPRHVLIVRGEGGRDGLGHGLAALGARVEYADGYRRVRSNLDPAPILGLWKAGAVNAVTVTSVEILDHLFDLLGESGAGLLRSTPCFTHHPRIAEAARDRGIRPVLECGPDEAALVHGMAAYFGERT